MGERKLASERKQEIRDAACSVFLERGIHNATMEEIIKRTSLSKGGVYHYYSNIYDILFDIMISANKYRIELMGKWMDDNQLLPQKPLNPEILAHMLTDKVLYSVPQAKLYALMLIGAGTDDKLRELYHKLLESCRKDLENFFAPYHTTELGNDWSFQGFTHIINMFIVSVQLLGAGDYLQAERDKVYAMIYAYLTQGESDE